MRPLCITIKSYIYTHYANEITIDDKLSWNLHISIKCNAVKKMLFLILKCCRLSWGLSRNTISLLYKSSVIPIILYNCAAWASAIRKKQVVASLKAAQRPFALAIGHLFKSTSTDAALVLKQLTQHNENALLQGF